jgi:hypothetical protein
MKMKPIRGNVYTTLQIYQDLDLLDNPFLRFMIDGSIAVIQDSHVATETLLSSVPKLAELKWQYVRTTHEWIPLFRAVDDAAVLETVDVAKDRDGDFWVTPKGFPRPDAVFYGVTLV